MSFAESSSLCENVPNPPTGFSASTSHVGFHLQAPQFGILGMKALSLLGSAERSTPKPVGARLRAGLTAKAHAKQ
jgi:hypothetical protein